MTLFSLEQDSFSSFISFRFISFHFLSSMVCTVDQKNRTQQQKLKMEALRASSLPGCLVFGGARWHLRIAPDRGSHVDVGFSLVLLCIEPEHFRRYPEATTESKL